MKTVCLSSSLRFRSAIRETTRRFGKIGITALFPNLDSGPDKDKLDMETMQSLCQDHFQAIDESDALYVIDPDGYIGTLVTVEIGYALGKGKPVYLSETANTLDLNSLAEGVIPLDSIEQFLSMSEALHQPCSWEAGRSDTNTEGDKMIVRMWHGRVPTSKAQAYRAFLNERAIPDYQSVVGNISVHILERKEGEITHFITMTFWENLDVIKGFAGDDAELAEYYPEDKDFLLEFEPTVVHYEIVGQS